jgi:hypothetical protein
MMQMLNWLLDLFALEHLVSFMFGIASATTWHYVKARIQRRILVIKWEYIVIPLAVGVIAYMAVQTQTNADCVREFQQVLRERSQVTSENDRISTDQRELIYGWLHALIFPPSEVAMLDTHDPRRQEYALQLTRATDAKFAELIAQQREFEQIRARNPLPPATCGL